MNLDRVQFPSLQPSPSANPVGRRIDVTVASPAAPDRGASVAAGEKTPQLGSIRGVLTSDEGRAIAALFGPDKRMYTAEGATQLQRPQLGGNLDFRV